jgi:uncharacterized membrane protein (UPF0127 family)
MNLFAPKQKNGMLWPVRNWILLALMALAVAGCKNESPVAVTPPPAQQATAAERPALQPGEVPRAEQGRPQGKLVTLKLWVGTNEVSAEIAQTMPQIMTGMMWRTNMAETDGMLFVFPQPHQTKFWMRNTLLPLSCAYIDPEGTILELHDMKPRDETSIPAATDQVQFVLEMNQGWFDRHNVKPGMVIATERGSLLQTFFRRR